MDDNFDAKFGHIPSARKTVDVKQVALMQWVICVAVLVTLQPPFVLTTRTPHDLRTPPMSIAKIATWSVLTTAAAYALHMSQVTPMRTFTTTCEILHRAFKA